MATKDLQRGLLSRLGAHTVQSRFDSRQLLEPTRRAFESKFEREVDPDATLPPEERARRAEMARRAHFARLAMLSAKTWRNRSRRQPGSPGGPTRASET